MIGNDCRCPGCGTCDAASEVSDLRKSLREWKQKHAELSRMNTSYIKHLHAAERERDDLKAKLDAELPAAWREDLASLNECLDRVGRERDELKSRLMHAEADAEQAIHNEAFMERQRVIAHIRAVHAHVSLDSRVSMRERGVMLDLINAIENGEHER